MTLPALLLAILPQTPPAALSPGHAARELYLMGTLFRGHVEAASPEVAERALESGVRALEAAERLLTTWDPGSPVSRINLAAPGRATAVDPGLLALLGEAESWAMHTDRAFDPTVGALIDAWDLRGAGHEPSAARLATALSAVGPHAFVRDEVGLTLTRTVEGAWIDTGAFGKGAALRHAADSLRAGGATRFLLDLGGQLLAWSGPDDAPWAVTVAHPARRLEAAAHLRLTDVSVATTGNSERGLVVDGRRVGHVLDPRTGLPAPDWGSVTVVARDPLVTDILSTALYVMGPDAGLAWAERLPDVGALFLVVSGGDLTARHNQAMTRWLVDAPASAASFETFSPERRSR